MVFLAIVHFEEFLQKEIIWPIASKCNNILMNTSVTISAVDTMLHFVGI